jgi:phosphotransferase system enzyme I (PtsI)
MTEVLLGMGLRQFSMHPAQIPAVKARVMECSAAEARRLAGRILRIWDADEVRRVVEAAQLRTPSAVA